MKSFNPKIGVISGFGPLAGADVVAKIFQYAAEKYGAVEDYEYPELVLISRGVDGFDNQGTINADFKPAILEIARQLNELEVSVVGIACNTAHLFHGPLSGMSDASVVNLIDSVVSEVSAHKVCRPLLLSSSMTKDTKLYTDKLDALGVAYVSPDKGIQKLVDRTIHLVMAHKLAEAGGMINKIISLMGHENFDFIVAACTELPIAMAHSEAKADHKVIDSNQVLAQVLTDHYYLSMESPAPPPNLLN